MGWTDLIRHKSTVPHPKNRRKPQGTATGLRFFEATNSTKYLQFFQA